MRLGAAYDLKNRHGGRLSPFAEFDYAAAKMPSVDEDGGAGRLHMDSVTARSQRSRLGLRYASEWKKADSSATGQFYAMAAWNCELLSHAGTLSGSFSEAENSYFLHRLGYPARNSMSLLAGVSIANKRGFSVDASLGGKCSGAVIPRFTAVFPCGGICKEQRRTLTGTEL